MKTSAIRRILLASACTAVLATPAFAQTAAEDEVGTEIVVTAQNREQSVNDVPIAIDVVGGEAIRDSGFGNMNDMSKIAPVVQINQDQGTVKVTVRGVGTNSNDEAQDTSVVVNIDGEYMNRPHALGSALFDIERVEVLRGPQGTLYGRNSTGGAINFITRKAGNDFGFNASASYGNYNAVRVDAGVDVPLGDIGGIRLAGFYDERDGYVNHPARGAFGPFPAFAGGASDDNQNYGGRVSLRFEPTESLTINLAGEYAEKHFTPSVFAYTDLNAAGNAPTAAGPGCNRAGYTRVAPNYAETLCIPNGTNFLSTIDRGNFAAPGFGLGRLDDETYAVRGRIAYEISDAATISYIGGYRKFAQTGLRTLPVSYRSFTYLNETKTQSHELRLNGVARGITYQIGGFYFKESVDVESGFMIPAGPNGLFLSYFGRDITSDSKSVFGQVEVPLGEKITLVGGLRYTDNSRDALYYNRSFVPGPPGPKGFVGVTPLVLGSEESKVTWLAGINYQPNSDTLIFAKASTGFKGGGFDSIGDYKPETNTAYEAGWKQSFGPNSEHQVNLGAFYYDYKDLQVAVLLDTTVGGQIFNAGKATIWGIEASGDFKVGPNTGFRVSFNYLSAKYDELFAQFNVYRVPGTGAGDRNGVGDLDPTAPGIQQPNFAGNRPAFSPEVVATIGFDQVMPLGSAGSLTFSANSMMKSSYFTDFFNYQDGKQSAFHQTDVSLTWKPASEKFSIQAFAKNLENIRPLTYGSFVSAGPDDIFNWQFGTPRTYGVRLSVDF